jgi:ABC-2 type transport system ATP-binding protein
MNSPIITFSRVTKLYRKHFFTSRITAVEDCSFTVERNAITGFVGPNGAGKTTSIKMILGLIRPTFGTVAVNGKDPLDASSRRGVSFLSERPYFYDHLCVHETLRFALRLMRQPRAGSEEPEIRRVLEMVELTGSYSKKVNQLSKGMQQRLAMAQALCGDPWLFILDEPMSGLDPMGRRLFKEIFRRLGQEGKTIFFSTHILDDVESLCSRVVVLSEGRLSYQGPISDLLLRGLKGTEIVVQGLPEQAKAELGALGCAVTEKPGGGEIVFVPAEKDLAACQRCLCACGILCLSMESRRTPLEEVIYKKEKER